MLGTFEDGCWHCECLQSLAGICRHRMQEDNVDPFPASGAVAGWEKTSDTRTFAAKDLWQYIDGDAEQYIQAGVVSTATSDYKYQGQLEAVVDVYTMGDPAGAQKILGCGQTKDAKERSTGRCRRCICAERDIPQRALPGAHRCL